MTFVNNILMMLNNCNFKRRLFILSMGEERMIRTCTIDDIQQILDLAFAKNNQPEHNSAYCYKEYNSIKQDFLQIIESKGNAVIGYFEEKTLIGVMGVYVDEEKHTADCCGPFVVVDDFVGISKLLFDYVKNHFNHSLQYNFFFDIRNKDCIAFMNTICAENQGNECCLTLKRENYRKEDFVVNVVPLPAEYTNSFVNLHDSIFPNVYVSGADIINSIEGSRKVFCVIENGMLIGYSVLKRTLNSPRATAEIIAVYEKQRRNGYGRVLLNELAKQAFYDEAVELIHLVVESINTNAVNLYYAFGFELDVENCFYCVK